MILLNKYSFFVAAILLFFCSCTDGKKKILVFSKTAGFRHDCIPEAKLALLRLGAEHNLLIDTTEDASYFHEEKLKTYSAVVFLNTTGDVLNHKQEADFERYIQSGGGYVGIHSATDTEDDWQWYNELSGAQFAGHPDIQKATLKVSGSVHPAIDHLPDRWERTDEWYNFKNYYDSVRVLIDIDEETYTGGTQGIVHPMSWFHEYDGGRAFYTGMGHTKESFKEELFLKHILGGLKYAIGNNKRDYSLVKTLRVPEENRFSNEVLDFNLDEPMELDELPGKGIIYIERRGAIKFYDFEMESTTTIDSIAVFYGNEDGLLGVAVDPNYNENNWVYFCYSDPGKISRQRISRFVLTGDSLSHNTEKVLLEIPTIRECCHSGGSIEFDADGLLYIGMGDNTNPFESEGYAPIDERVGRQLWDAQRSAANTNDLRGKILRIRPEPDGTYSIPDGNLFSEGTENTRPEVYAMGLRNPFRFSIDSKTDYLYWGDVGPDAGVRDSLRGPEGLGEFNQAKKAGFWGWPYTRGNNQVYFDYDFKSEKSKELFDAANLINDSPNNSGLKKLPPAQPSMIWYGYGDSEEFPWLGSGGVNPMAGPVFHKSDFKEVTQTFPEYFEDKLFVYEWMRDWIYLLSLDTSGAYVKAEPFMPSTSYSHPMDMFFASDGQLYILEYGQKWNSRNMDARLNRVKYLRGNRPPVAKFTADRQVGAVPLNIQFSAAESVDYDKDELKYEWYFTGEDKVESTEKNPRCTFGKPGEYDVRLVVTDGLGSSSEFNQKILAGNEEPEIKMKLETDNVVFWKGKKVSYDVSVTDKEDGSTKTNSIDSSKVRVTLTYIPEGEDLILATAGHQQNAVPKGLELIRDSDCKSCHAEKTKVSGPSYVEIAQRYSLVDKSQLVRNIIKGSHGFWGEALMSAHPQLSVPEVEAMVSYILSLDPEKVIEEELLGLSGELSFEKHAVTDMKGKYILMASYLDQGSPELKNSQLSALNEIVFIPPLLEAEDAAERSEGTGIWDNGSATLVGALKENTILRFEKICFDDLEGLDLMAHYVAGYNYAGYIEVRRESREGELLGTQKLGYHDELREKREKYLIDLKHTEGIDDLYLVFKNDFNQDQFVLNADWIYLNYNQ